MIGAAAMNYGGRILEIENSTGRVRHIAGPAKHILSDIGLRLEIGDSPSLEDLCRFTDRMADMTLELIEGTSLETELQKCGRLELSRVRVIARDVCAVTRPQGASLAVDPLLGGSRLDVDDLLHRGMPMELMGASRGHADPDEQQFLRIGEPGAR